MNLGLMLGDASEETKTEDEGGDGVSIMSDSEYPQIRHGVPVPKRWQRGRWVETAESMSVGSHTDLNNADEARSLHDALKRHGMTGTRRSLGGGKYRVWRVA